MKIVIYGESDILDPYSASHRYVALLCKGLRHSGLEVLISGSPKPEDRSPIRRIFRGLRRLATTRDCQIVVYYGQFFSTLVGLWLITRIRHRALVVFLVEWPVTVPNRSFLSRLNAVLFCRVVFSIADSAVVISKFLEEKGQKFGKVKPILRVPIMSDSADWVGVEPAIVNRPFALYCADLDGYIHDAYFVVDVMSATNRRLDLILLGKATPETTNKLHQHAVSQGLAVAMKIVSHIPDRELRSLMLAADALFLPLWDDDRSRARFPSKLADYLRTGSPIITSPIGEVEIVLQNHDGALFVDPGDVVAAARIINGLKIRPVAEHKVIEGPAELNYVQVTAQIADFFEKNHQLTKPIRTNDEIR